MVHISVLDVRRGWVAERLKAPVLKTGERESASWVRIPPHPPLFSPQNSRETRENSNRDPP